MNPIKDRTILVTGGTGSFGRMFTKIALSKYSPKVIRIFSRDELKQSEMKREFDDDRLRFFIGDIRDPERLDIAMRGCDLIIHCAALKRIESCEYNVYEAIRTNIQGAVNLSSVAIKNGVEKVFALSTDKACQPTTAYGVTKAAMEKILIQSNTYAKRQTKLSCSRYGNVLNSRGSVIPLFNEQKKTGCLTLTDPRMTRFFLSLEVGVEFVISCLSMMKGGEIFIPKIPSMMITDLATAIAPECRTKVIGIRPGEKLHEVLLSVDEARHTLEIEDMYQIIPEFPFWGEDTYLDLSGKKLPDGFTYSSETARTLSVEEIRTFLEGIS